MVKPKRRKTEKKQAPEARRPPEDLLDLPDDCLGHIVKHCDFPSVQVLRRTNHRLQTIVSVVKPRTHIHEIYVEGLENENITNYSIRLGILLNRGSEHTKFYPEGSKILVEYCNYTQGCDVKLIMEDGKTGVVRLRKRGLTRETVFLNDLNSVLNQMAGPCEIFRFDCNHDTFQQFLVQSLGSIRARKADLNINSTHFEGILGKFEAGTLSQIHLRPRSNQHHLLIHALYPVDFASLEQWTRAEHLEADYCHFGSHGGEGTVVQHFSHFRSLDVMFAPDSLEDLVLLKDDQIRHVDEPKTDHKIYFHQSPFDGIEEIFGEPIMDPPEDTPPHIPIYEKLVRNLNTKRYSTRTNRTIHFHEMELPGLPDHIDSFSFFFQVPGRDLVLRMKCIEGLWHGPHNLPERDRNYCQVKFEFVPREGVDPERIIS